MGALSDFMYVCLTNHSAFSVCLRWLKRRSYYRLWNSIFKQKMVLGCWFEETEWIERWTRSLSYLSRPRDYCFFLLLIFSWSPFCCLYCLLLHDDLFLRVSQSYQEKGGTWKRHQSSVLASRGTLCMSDDEEVIVPLLTCIPFICVYVSPRS